jgi:hypothetical protein
MNPSLRARTRIKVSVSRLRVALFAAPAVFFSVSWPARAASAATAATPASAEITTPAPASAFAPEPAPAPQKLGVSFGASYLGTLGGGIGPAAAGCGVALSSGLRLALGAHAALSVDLGYGVLAGPSSPTVSLRPRPSGDGPTVSLRPRPSGDGPTATQDRWWILPAVAWVLPAEVAGAHVRWDIGAGLGLGASSGYASFGDYTRGPFSPAWAYQLVPAARAHVMAAMPIGRDVDAFVRVEAAALLVSGTRLGFRDGNPDPDPADTTWFDLGAGVQFRLL